MRLKGNELSYLKQILDKFDNTGSGLSSFYKSFLGGEFVQAFESAFAKYIGTKYAVAVSSGTAALHTALLAALDEKQNPGKFSVLTSPYTFVASASSICMAGQTPIFCDIDINTLNMDPLSFEREDPEPDAIITVHLLGQPCNLDLIKGRFPNAPIIEDCAQSLGAKYGDRMTGSIGALGCFSSTTRILTPNGSVTIRDIRVGDEVLTPHGPKKVKQVHKRQYEGDWALICFGKMDSSFKLRATIEHPLYVYRRGRKDWLPIGSLQEGDEVFVPTKNCEMCNTDIPFYRKFCDTCYRSQSREARELQRKLHLKTGDRLRRTTDAHWEGDVKPIAARFEADGYRVIPLVRPEPDFVAIKGETVLAVEVESKVSPRISKLEQYVGDKRFDDIVWVTKPPKLRSQVYGHASYSIDTFEGVSLARVPVLSVKTYTLRGKHLKRPVYNLTVEDSPTYFAKFVLVHNCFSFQETKSLTTLGEGGMITTNNERLANYCRAMRNHGEKYMGTISLGWNYRMTEAQAAFGLAQLERFPETLNEQVACAKIVRDNLPEGLIPVGKTPGTEPSYFLVGTEMSDPLNTPLRDRFVETAMKTLGFKSPLPGATIGPGYKELVVDLPYFRTVNPTLSNRFPLARRALRYAVWFDIHRWVTPEETQTRMAKLRSLSFDRL